MSMARTVAIGALAILAAASLSRAGPTDFGGRIKPNTPEAAAALAQLEKARHLDRLNAQGYTGKATSEYGQYLYSKVRQCTELINQLQSGYSVSRDDVTWALDNSAGRIYGPGF